MNGVPSLGGKKRKKKNIFNKFTTFISLFYTKGECFARQTKYALIGCVLRVNSWKGSVCVNIYKKGLVSGTWYYPALLAFCLESYNN